MTPVPSVARTTRRGASTHPGSGELRSHLASPSRLRGPSARRLDGSRPRDRNSANDGGDERRAARSFAARSAPDLQERRVGRAVSATSASEGTTRGERAAASSPSHGFHDRGPPLASEETQLETGPHAAVPRARREAFGPGGRAATPRASPARRCGTRHSPRSKGDTFVSRREAIRDGSRAPAAAWEHGLGLRGAPAAGPARAAGSSFPPGPGLGTRGLGVTCAHPEAAAASPGHVGPARGKVRSWRGLGGGASGALRAPSPRGPAGLSALPPSPSLDRGLAREGARGDTARAGSGARRSFPCGDPHPHPPPPPGGASGPHRGGRASPHSLARGVRSRAGMTARHRRGARGAGCPLEGEASVLHPCGLRGPPSAADPSRGAVCSGARVQPAARPGSARFVLGPPTPALLHSRALRTCNPPRRARGPRWGGLCSLLGAFHRGRQERGCLGIVLREMCNLEKKKKQNLERRARESVSSAAWGPASAQLALSQSLHL